MPKLQAVVVIDTDVMKVWDEEKLDQTWAQIKRDLYAAWEKERKPILVVTEGQAAARGVRVK